VESTKQEFQQHSTQYTAPVEYSSAARMHRNNQNSAGTSSSQALKLVCNLMLGMYMVIILVLASSRKSM
jgi:hypothetical protein